MKCPMVFITCSILLENSQIGQECTFQSWVMRSSMEDQTLEMLAFILSLMISSSWGLILFSWRKLFMKLKLPIRSSIRFFLLTPKSIDDYYSSSMNMEASVSLPLVLPKFWALPWVALLSILSVILSQVVSVLPEMPTKELAWFILPMLCLIDQSSSARVARAFLLSQTVLTSLKKSSRKLSTIRSLMSVTTLSISVSLAAREVAGCGAIYGAH